MNRTQKFFKSILPVSWAESMEAESRQWMMQCSQCGFEQSVWDLGGIRWEAAGNPQRKMFCQNCRQSEWHKTYKKQEKSES